MRVGYIVKCKDNNGKESFKYQEANAVRRIGVKKDSVKIPFLYGTYDYEEIKSTTDELINNTDIMIVTEPFFTDDSLKERCEKWCNWANSCEHREYSFFGEI